MTSNEDEERAVRALARRLYLEYCDERNHKPYAGPWVPRWAVSYARVAVDAYGFDPVDVAEVERSTSVMEEELRARHGSTSDSGGGA